MQRRTYLATVSLAASLGLSGCSSGNPANQNGNSASTTDTTAGGTTDIASDAPIETKTPSTARPNLYLELLDTLQEDRLGYGYGHLPGGEDETGERHWPMAYSLIANSEARRAIATGSSDAATKAIQSATWLYTNRDRNGNGRVGWGLPAAWDAGQDGSTNPRDTEYGITTALAVQALLDVADLYTQRSERSERRRSYLRASKAALVPYVKEFYETTDAGRYFWYSTRESDNYDALNVTAMLAGQIQRLTQYEEVDTPDFEQAASEAVTHIYSFAGVNNDEWLWPYWGAAYPGNSRPTGGTDVLHQSYTIDGVLTYAANGGQRTNEISRRGMRRSLANYRVGETITEYVNDDEEARVWGQGYLLHVLTRFFPESTLHDTASRIVWNTPLAELKPQPQISRDGYGAVRHNTHLLLGLASDQFTAEVPAKRP